MLVVGRERATSVVVSAVKEGVVGRKVIEGTCLPILSLRGELNECGLRREVECLIHLHARGECKEGYLHNCQARTWLGVWCYKWNSEHNRQLKLALGCPHAAHSVDSDGDMAVYIGDICNGRVVPNKFVCLFLHIAYGRFATMAYIHRITASWPWPAGEASPLVPIRTKNKNKNKRKKKQLQPGHRLRALALVPNKF
jgi:hypothetical protein